MSQQYPVHEVFHTWQGEGMHMGMAAYFIRLFGCPVHCPWCDSAGTWHPDYIPEKIARHTAEELATMAARHQCEFVVLTGGEPTIHNLQPLTDALHAKGLEVHLETSGAFPIRGEIDWITLSPKWWKTPLRENIAQANELKIIVDEPDTISRWVEWLGELPKERPIWLHPEWSRHNDSAILETISNTVKEKGAPFRAGYQLHKLYRVDQLDPHAAPPAPLGGDPERGF